MKNLITFLLSICPIAIVLACSCVQPPSLCTYANLIDGTETELIFTGKLIQADSIDDFTIAYEFEVERIHRGEIILPDSPLASDSEYENSETTVWVLGGSDNLCFRFMEEERALIAVQYTTLFFGYSASSCYNDYFPIDENDMIYGKIWDKDEDSFLSIDEISTVLETSCTTSTENHKPNLFAEVNIYPNPTFGELNIEIKSASNSPVVLEVFDAHGKQLSRKKMVNRLQKIDLNTYSEGVYFIKIVGREEMYTRRVVKY